MAETPKDENKISETVAGAPGHDSVAADAAVSASEDSLDGGAAPEAADALADSPETVSDSVSIADAGDHIEGGEGHDGLAASRTDSSSISPWSSAAKTDIPPESPDPTSAPAAKSGGGAGRLVVFLILIVLVAGVGYATYPEWREEAVPYAEMIGVSLPEVPAEVDADIPPPAVAGAADGGSASASSTAKAPAAESPAQTTATEAAPAPTAPADPAAASVAGDLSTGGPTAGDPAVSGAAFQALAERVAAAETEIERLSSRPAPATTNGASADTAEMSDRVTTLETRLSALGDEMAIVRQGLGAADDTDGIAEVASGLTGRLAALDTRLSALETKVGAPAVTPQDVSALATRIDGLAQETESGTSDLTARIEALAASQKALAERLAEGRNVQERAGAFLLATNLLAAAATDSGTYSAELDAVESAALDQPEVAAAIAALKSHAGGVPSVADLRSRFPAVAASVIDASIVGADDGVVGTALTRIAALVTLRRTETAEGDDIDAIVNRAEAAANAGDLPAAVEALSALDGDPAKVAAPWIAEAKARIAVNGAVRALQARALATLSGS
ncbi:MAG: mitofilin family membrane protein [Thalassobaculaceae bacterium]|nr:mitofilin family membrane protein [Thalassobaculaceae bacterium]